MEPKGQFQQFVVDKLTRIDEVLTEHNAQTADIAKDVKDLQKHKYIIYGAIGCISFIATVVGILTLL